MESYDSMAHHPISEKLVEAMMRNSKGDDPTFFRAIVAFNFGLLSTMMRCRIQSPDGGLIPTNIYAIGLGPSGCGKTRSVNLMEDEVTHKFRSDFRGATMPILAEKNLPKIANERAIKKGGDPDEELEKTRREYDQLGPMPFTFDSASVPAIKQIRHKLLMADCGSINLIIDEIGANLLGNMEAFHAYLELFDVGKIRSKLIKSTSEQNRNEEIDGATPTNMLLFGTLNKLMNGGKVEEEFYSLLDMGYARRSFFALVKGNSNAYRKTAQERFAERRANTVAIDLNAIADQLYRLSDISNANKTITVSEEVELLFLEYEEDCLNRADLLGAHEDIKRADLVNRHFKALKLAGTYAFVDGMPEILRSHALAAIKVAEESGEALAEILTRDRPYVKLAKYISEVGRNVSLHDLVEDLPFFKGHQSQKQEMLDLAIAYGYQNNILIKKTYNDSVVFYRGESLKEANLDEMRVSYSQDIAHGYNNDLAKFDEIHKLTQLENFHWINHHVRDGHRKEDMITPGFSMVVVDVDGGTKMSLAQKLLADYKALFYTTKRHTPEENRYRIILPLNYELRLDAKDYRDFMQNIYDWLPFAVDTGTGQRARKWMSNNGTFAYQDGELLDALPFIPNTSKCEERKKIFNDQKSMDNLERWFINNTGDGNRNNQLLRYAMLLVDADIDYKDIQLRVMELNSKLIDALSESEILGTIMSSVGKAWGQRHTVNDDDLIEEE